MPGIRDTSTGRLWLVLGVAVLVPALAGLPAGAAPKASAQAPTAAQPTQAVPAADVRQPTVTTVALKGLDRAVLAAAPKPKDHDHGTVGALAVDIT